MTTFRDRSKLYQVLLFGLPILAIVLVIVAVVVLLGRPSSSPTTASDNPAKPSADQKLAVPALQRNARNVAAASNANNLMASLMEYANNNNGKLPESIEANKVTGEFRICGSSCDQTNPSTVKFQHDANSSLTVSFQNYREDLKVTGLDVMYIVPKAACDENGHLSAGTSRSMAVLYGNEISSGFETKCVGS